MTRGLAGLPRSFWFLVLGMWINRLGAFVLPVLSLYLQEREGLSENASLRVFSLTAVGHARHMEGPTGRSDALRRAMSTNAAASKLRVTTRSSAGLVADNIGVKLTPRRP